MAALDWLRFEGWFKKNDPGLVDSDRARDLVREAYKKSGGPTPDLKRVYNSFLANQQKRDEERRAAEG